MPFQIVRDDITHISADVIVNSANPHAVIGGGVDAAIHMAAGPRLIEARKKIGEIAEGDVRYSRAFDLLARYVFHVVGPDCRKPQPNMEEKLKACYTKSLQLAKKLSCESIAFPLISTGIYDCPKEEAFQIAISAISEFLMQNEMDVTLVVYDPSAYGLSNKLFHDVKAYVDEHYVESAPKDGGIGQLPKDDLRRASYIATSQRRAPGGDDITAGSYADEADVPAESFTGGDIRYSIDESIDEPIGKSIESTIDLYEKMLSVDEVGQIKKIKPNGDTFSEMLLRLIDKTGKKDSDIYLKAGQTRQLFSKIRNQKNYQPSKNTVLAFAFALELNKDQTMDLLKSAGYTLSDGIKMDVALQYFIEKGFYDLMEIKSILFGLEIEFR